jgi:ethanolamine utilization cobalamin adenosyltransferase
MKKPENMTCLRGNTLVPKTHPRIAFRGLLDSLEADILEIQLCASEQGGDFYPSALGELLDCVRELMSAEVNERPVAEVKLFGFSLDELREQSHRVKEVFGIDIPLPDYTMGALALRLNALRAGIRRVELAAAEIFSAVGENSREDIIRVMNRLSSAAWWLFCHCIANKGQE